MNVFSDPDGDLIFHTDTVNFTPVEGDDGWSVFCDNSECDNPDEIPKSSFGRVRGNYEGIVMEGTKPADEAGSKSKEQ